MNFGNDPNGDLSNHGVSELMRILKLDNATHFFLILATLKSCLLLGWVGSLLLHQFAVFGESPAFARIKAYILQRIIKVSKSRVFYCYNRPQFNCILAHVKWSRNLQKRDMRGQFPIWIAPHFLPLNRQTSCP